MSEVRLEAVTTSFFGYGCIDMLSAEIKKRGYRRSLIVTDSFLYKSGTADRVGQAILGGDAEYAIFYLVTPNPTVEVINECIKAARALDVDFLTAVGGGSAIDTAKAVSIVLANGGRVEDYEGANRSLKAGMPVVAVNTTAGTGSEVTQFYIVTDTVKHSKMCMVDVNCKIAIAINDTQFMVSMPKGLTAATGMDAMTHAIEAVQAKTANPLTNKDALWAITQINNYLPTAVSTPDNVQARDMMSYAQYTAGMAFSNSGVGMVHAMAHALGGKYNLPHGICNAVLLPYIMSYNASHANLETQFRSIACALGINGAYTMDYNELSSSAVNHIKALSAQVGITQTLNDLKVKREDLRELAATAMKDLCMQSNPVMPTAEDVVSVYEQAF
ncbi:MAG: iron-containing alcohol dehydrogenase [Oscillospiraceae bacterium]|nr:iron-containing alcohol dehydrogenase [Oscillospiraceae bacterium]